MYMTYMNHELFSASFHYALNPRSFVFLCGKGGGGGARARKADGGFPSPGKKKNVSNMKTLIAELLCGRRPQEWSPILILRGMLVFFYGHGKRNGSRVRAPYVRPSHFMTFLHEAIFAQLLANGVRGIA